MGILQHLSEIQNLPTLPEIVLRIQELIMSEEGNATLLARIIEQDPTLAAKILKVANSSYYGSSHGRISSINLAITRIGFNEIGHIALAVNFVKQFSHRSNILDYKKFWLHSLTSAHICKKIAEQNEKYLFETNDSHMLFMAGLLHDIGILIYDQFFHKEFEQIIDQALLNELSYLQCERTIVPTETHTVVGSALLELWKLDMCITAAVRNHHSPEKTSEHYQKYAQVLHVAEYYLCNRILGSFEGSISSSVDEIIESLGLSNDMIQQIVQNAQEEVEHSELVNAFESDSTYSQLKAI